MLLELCGNVAVLLQLSEALCMNCLILSDPSL